MKVSHPMYCPPLRLFVFEICLKLAANEKGLWSGGEFETLLPERPPM